MFDFAKMFGGLGKMPMAGPKPDMGWSAGTSVDNGGAFKMGLNGMPSGLGENFNKHAGKAMMGAAEQMPGGFKAPQGAFADASAMGGPVDENTQAAKTFMDQLAQRRAMARQGGY